MRNVQETRSKVVEHHVEDGKLFEDHRETVIQSRSAKVHKSGVLVDTIVTGYQVLPCPSNMKLKITISCSLEILKYTTKKGARVTKEGQGKTRFLD